jgi:hypothetical protein
MWVNYTKQETGLLHLGREQCEGGAENFFKIGAKNGIEFRPLLPRFLSCTILYLQAQFFGEKTLMDPA